VLVDTNILWQQKKDSVANLEFETFWSEYSTEFDLTLIVPEVVRAELLFQHAESARKALERASESFRDLSTVTAHQYSPRIEVDRVKRQVEEKIDHWLLEARAVIAPLPYDAVNWREVVRAAVWHEPPFALDPKNPDNEKGFRDALILECVSAHVATLPAGVMACFVTNDKLLQAATQTRCATCSIYEGTQAMGSYLKLTAEKLQKEFITAILQKAQEKFFTQGDPESLYHREQIEQKLEEKYSVRRLAPSPQPLSFGPSWTALDVGRWWITLAPEFRRKSARGRYHWRNVVTFVRWYKKDTPWAPTVAQSEPGGMEQKDVGSTVTAFSAARAIITAFGGPDPQILICKYGVDWACSIKTDGRFHKFAIEQLVEIGKEFRQATDQERKFYELPTSPAAAPPPSV